MAKNTTEAAAVEEQKPFDPNEYAEELVSVKIPRTKEDKEDVFVGINERTWLIKRGVEVSVPRCVAEVLRDREDMLNVIYDFETKNAKDIE